MPRKVPWEAAGPLRPAYERVDWAASPVGPVSSWSGTLVDAVDLALNTRFPVTLMWGPEFVLIYNAAYVPLIGDKHPSALGAPAREVFPEAWEQIGPMMQQARAGQATWVEDELVPLARHGLLQEAYFTFSYSPVTGRDGAIEGVIDIAFETTRQVVDRRRLVMLTRLRDALDEAERADEVPTLAAAALRSNEQDFASVEIVAAEAVASADVLRFPLGDRGRWVLLVPRARALVGEALFSEFLALLVSMIDRAMTRLGAVEDEHVIAKALQRSLLSKPVEPDHVQVAVRYLPAARAEVGGDWYDAFLGPDGALALVIGDITGHDQRAAAIMGQVRNLLRGVYFTLRGSPAAALSALDDALASLAVGDYATVILARLEQGEQDASRGLRTLRWANAGHPPPVLIAADGNARLLATEPELLLGLAAGARTDHTVTLEPGATVVFYTDGLVEERDAPLTERLDWLAALLNGTHHLDAERLADQILQSVSPTDDDIALLILRVHPEDQPQPCEAGPGISPLGQLPPERSL